MNTLAILTTAWVLQMSHSGNITAEDAMLQPTRQVCEEQAMRRISTDTRGNKWACQEVEVKAVGTRLVTPVGPGISEWVDYRALKEKHGATHFYVLSPSASESGKASLQGFKILKYKD